MTDELVERLNRADEYEPLGHDGWEAADRIEALTAECDRLRIALTDAESYLKRGLDKSALSLISSVLKGEV